MKRTRYKRVKSSGRFLCMLVLVVLVGCSAKQSSDVVEENTGNKGELTIGAKGFTEQSLLLTITAVYLKENGYDVETVHSMTTNNLRSALVNEDIDLYWEYTGTALKLFFEKDGPSTPEGAYEKVKELDEANGMYWLGKSDFNNEYSIVVRERFANEHDMTTISDLAEYIQDKGDINFISETEFYRREDGLNALEEHYRFNLRPEQVTHLDSTLTYKAIEEQRADAIVGFVTDAWVHNSDLIALKDDKEFFLPFNAAPVIRKDTAEKYDTLPPLLNNIVQRLDSETMRTLNYKVDVLHENTLEISREWLKEEGLVD